MYGTAFYDQIRGGAQSSAASVAHQVTQLIQPRRVVDVGCGEGWWPVAFADYGAETVVGIDGAHVTPAPELLSVGTFIPHDLVNPIPDDVNGGESFDLAVCLEVAEHLPPGRAWSLVAELCDLADVVLFSAAVPGQPGTGHVNCQPPGYWAGLFAEHGYTGSGALRARWWGNPDVEWWYQQNMLLFTANEPFLAKDGCPYVIHPELYRWALDGGAVR